MSERLFKFLLSELKTFRLVCSRPACGAVTEVSSGRLDSVGRKGACPVCSHDIYPGLTVPINSEHPLVKLAAAIEAVQQAQAKPDAAQIEFVLPDDD